jgi:lipopolysaccharide export system protein LptA
LKAVPGDRGKCHKEQRAISTDGGSALAGKAVYSQNDEKVVLTGSPVVKQGDDFVEGSRITLFLRDQRSIVEGSENKKLKAVISPRRGKR